MNIYYLFFYFYNYIIIMIFNLTSVFLQWVRRKFAKMNFILRLLLIVPFIIFSAIGLFVIGFVDILYGFYYFPLMVFAPMKLPQFHELNIYKKNTS